MFVLRVILYLLCSCLFCLQGRANPENVLVGDLTFTRPEKWIWVAPSANTIVITRFIVPGADGKKPAAEVRFYMTDREPAATIELWKNYFPDPTERAKAKEERITMGGRSVVFVTLRGTFVYPKHKPQRGHMFVGVQIPSGEKAITARIVGSAVEVEKSVGDFRKMIEGALIEAEKTSKLDE